MIALYLLLQLVVYGPWWLGFATIAFLMARYLDWGGAFLGQITIFFLVSWLDWLWIQEQMSRPGWNGVPDQDGVFFVGVVLRVVMVNTVLIGVNAIGIRMRRRAKVARQARGFEVSVG